MPGGHESPSGAFKPQTGLRSKCRVFSAARSQRFRCAGPDGLRHPASASCLGRHSHPAGRCPNSSSLYPPLAAVVAVANKGLLALDNPKAEVETKKCQPLRSDGLRHPASASCLGRHSHPAGRCPNSSSLHPPQAAVVAVAHFSRFSDLQAPQSLRDSSPQGATNANIKIIFPLIMARAHAVAISNSVTPAQTTRHILWRLHLPLQNPPPHGNRSPVRRGSSWPGPSGHRPVPAARRRHAR